MVTWIRGGREKRTANEICCEDTVSVVWLIISEGSRDRRDSTSVSG